MKPVVCLYCEGTDAKLAVVAKTKDGIQVQRVASLTISRTQGVSSKPELYSELNAGGLKEDEISFDALELSSETEAGQDTSDVGQFHAALHDLKVNNMNYIPIVTEPIVNYHSYEGPRDESKKKLVQTIIKDLQVTKGIIVDEGSMDIMELNEKTTLGVFIEGDIPCVGLVNQLANYNRRRYLKIPTIKTAELSLAYFVSKNTKFFPEDYTLIVHIGKEYSKLIFLEGQRLKHIGSTLDIGTKNLHTYDVYFSKILLEMENGGIPKLDNVIICGEDRSENLILSFYGTFPEANVSELKFPNLDISLLKEEEVTNLALYAVPIAAATEYFDELDKTYIGVNFLPRYVQENQRIFDFGWHGYVLLPILFGVTFYFTFNILDHSKHINELNLEIERLMQRQTQNQELIQKITPLEQRINSFDATQKILDSAAVGAGIWNRAISRVSDFAERRRNFWVSKLETVNRTDVKLDGYSLSRSVLTEFAELYKTSLLKKINYEPLREKSAFSYTLSFKLKDDSLNTK